MEYIPLQLKTSYSILESLNDIKKIVPYAKKLGYKTLAITDNYMFGVIEFYQECEKNGIKPIIGLNITVNNTLLLLYAKNNLGYQNLIKLSIRKSYQKLEIDDLIKYKDNLILIMPHSSFNKAIYEIYQDKYIGYSTIEEKNKIKEQNKVLITDVLYSEKEDYIYLNYLYLIKENKFYGESPLLNNKGRHLLTNNEVMSMCTEEDLKTIQEINHKCTLNIKKEEDILPVYKAENNASEYLKALCQKGLAKRLNNCISLTYQERLNSELKTIEEMGFCDYFLIVWDYVKYAKQNHILVGPGRGSAAGSLVSYVLGITDIDPIKYNLLFERFLNKERITMPDIDIDFDSTKREEVINYVVNKYGKEKVCGIITFNTMSAKQIIKDLCKVLKINSALSSSLSKMITSNDLFTSLKENDKLNKIIKSSKELQNLFKIANKLEGLPRHISVNAAGIVISRKNLDEIIPLYQNDNGLYLSAYSKKVLEQLGLLKMDFLGISNLTMIDTIIKNINKEEKLNLSFSSIPLDDLETLEIFQKGETDGVFQFESNGMKKFLKKLFPTSINDLIAAIALFRPGPIDNIGKYINRKNNTEKIEYIDKSLEHILKNTYGIIIYQEQIMQIANVFANYSYSEADLLRRAMSKKEEKVLINERTRFIKKSIENNHSAETATKVYDHILKFASYGFNLSHSVAYTIVAYKMAYLKRHYYKYFISYLLTNNTNNKQLIQKYLYEVKTNNINIIPPDINISDNQYKITNKGIQCPLGIINNINNTIISEIITNQPYDDFIAFLMKNYSPNINKKVIISLIQAGCFDSFEYNKKTLITNLDNIINYCILVKEEGLTSIAKPSIKQVDEYTKKELISIEENVFGFYISNHPVSKYQIDGFINTNKVISNYNKKISMILYISKINEIITKKNDVMVFINGSDEYGEIKLVLFPDVYKRNGHIKVSDIIKINGQVEKRYDEYQIIVKEMDIIEREGETCQNYQKLKQFEKDC